MSFKSRILSFALLLLGASTLHPTQAFAAPRSAPVIRDFYVESEDRLAAGSKIRFTVEGTPNAAASVRISGLARRITLTEVEPGVYEGTYPVRSSDRITAATSARATLTKRNRSTSALLDESLGITIGAITSVPSTVLGTTSGILSSTVPAIERFVVSPIQAIEPGVDIGFTMEGTPGGQASFSIAGVAGAIPMREVRRGRYEGAYTVRRADNIADHAAVTGTLVVGGKTLRTGLNQSLVAGTRGPRIGNLSPAQNSTVAPGEVTTISGTFDAAAGGEIDPRSVTLTVAGQDVTGNAVVTPQFFTYRADLKPGTYTAAVSARDRNGNLTRQSWDFKVATSVAMAEAILPLQITSHQNSNVIGAGLTEIRGKTAPNAMVDVQVQSVSAVFGFFGMSQKLLSQTVQADSYGNFAFTFQPRSVAKDARFEVALTASKNGMTKVENLLLLQQQ